MDDRRFDELLDDAARTYRAPPEPPLDAIWLRVEAEAFAPAVPRRTGAPWSVFAAALAASLVLGVALGRFSGRGVTARAVAAASTPVPAPPPAGAAAYQRSTGELLGRTAVLLAALPRDASSNATLTDFPAQATQLLTTTRLLLDSPVGADPRMKELLQDLELVLAQVARIQPRHERMELTLITQTLEERDVVPRIRSAVADLGSLDY